MQMNDNKDQEVNVAEKGNLIISSNSITPGGSGTQTSTFTVPAGKKWILKAVDMHGVSLTATVTYMLVRLTLGSDNHDIEKDTTGGDTIYSQYGNHNITLSAGDKVKLIHQLGAYTSGDILHSLLVQESEDA